jgi:hypothetical protein
MAETVKVLSRDRDGVDTKELRQLTKDFMGWKPDKQLHKALRVAGELIATDAKILVATPGEYIHKTSYGKRSKDRGVTKSTHGSSKIIPTIKTRVSKTRLSVVAGGAGVPIAGLQELGNRGGGKSQAASRRGVFRHPIFGDRGRWVNQGMHPYLLPAAEKNKKKIEALEGHAVAESFREYRFPVEG